MRVIRIYQAGNYQIGDTVSLSTPAAHHVSGVLRMKSGDELILFPGNGQEYLAQITSLSKKEVQVSIQTSTTVSRESPCQIHLAQAISKGERMEWVVQKAVELGVSSITPIHAHRSVVKLDEARQQKKIAQWQAIAVAACEQSGRTFIPTVHPAIALDTYLDRATGPFRFILSPHGNNRFQEASLNNKNPIHLLIGPEGGFDDREIEHAKTHGFQTVQLGPRILRTETAALTALSILQAITGDL